MHGAKGSGVSDTDNADVDSCTSQYWWWGLGALLLVGISIWLTPWVTERWADCSSSSEIAAFADRFGVTNAVFSGLAFGGVIIAILMQRQELELQRKELVQTRKVMVKQTKELASQAATSNFQAFEATFFHMVSLHHELVNGLQYNSDGLQTAGRRGILFLARKLSVELKGGKPKPESPELDLESRRQRIADAYVKFYEGEAASAIGHYFRNLYVLIRFIAESPVEEKQSYVRIVRAQLSTDELFLIFYNCVGGEGRERFLPLADEYHLFNNLPVKRLADPSDQRFTKSSMHNGD